jgi:hypothetical protein
MIDWIVANKTWLFDGVGIVAISVAISLGAKLYRKYSSLPTVFYTSNDAIWNERFMPLIKNSRARHAFFVEYSSANIRPVIDVLLGYGWEVTLLMKLPSSDQVAWRRGKIESVMEAIKRDLGQELSKRRLDIYFYSSPGSIRIRYLENVVVSLGWYTYDRRQDCAVDDQVWGHTNIMVSTTPKTKEWEEFKVFADGILCRMKADAVHISELETATEKRD